MKSKQQVFISDAGTGAIFSGTNTTEVLKAIWDTINSSGFEYKGQRGLTKTIRGTTIIINNPFDEINNYPYWSKKEDDWYQANFVQKETNQPPEKLAKNSDIYPYKYVWRSRYHDSGLGYIKGVVDLFLSQNFNQIPFKDKKELVAFLKSTFKTYHPETILSVLSWKGRGLMDYYLKHPEITNLELKANRRDILQSVIDEVRQNPNTRRAITPSFTYEQIDHSAVSGGVPVYQNYQLYVEFDNKGQPNGLISFHLHRAMDAKGGTQLDISHDRAWGAIASKAIGLPLKRMIIYCNDIYYFLPAEGGNQDLVNKTDIRSWLFAVSDSYDPKIEDVEKRLSSPIYQQKIDHTWHILQTS